MDSTSTEVTEPVVLFVDDDVPTRMLAKEFLTQAGFEVVEAESGEQALDIIVEVEPDLILLDVEMSGINGFEVCKRIRTMPKQMSTPVLMLTGLNNNEAIDLAYEAGATDFSAKPINWSLLCHRLRYIHRSGIAEKKIHQLAYYDTLTGLANRVFFQDKLRLAIERASSESSMLGILYFDLDSFKRINDTFGHATGDQMLVAVSRRLETIIEKYRAQSPDTVLTFARMGGDEFALLLNKLVHEESITKLATEIIDGFTDPFELDGNKLYSSPSIGVSVYPRDGETLDTLLTNTDLAMYEAKSNGKNSFSLHNSAQSDEIRRRHYISVLMRQAIKDESFSVYYHPQLNLHTGQVFAAEALCRWTHADLGFISPEEFIPIAEDNGLIKPLGTWVLRHSCEYARQWIDNGFFYCNVAVNISVLQFMQAGFVDQVAAILAETKLPPENLELEITESLLAIDTDNAVSTLRRLKDIGVTLSIDDFGTGYSSLSQLKNFPIDRLKIDQSFIRNVTNSNEDAEITRAIIAMAKSLNIHVLAEGVETIDHLHFLKENGCDEIQGYLLCKPSPIEVLVEQESKLIEQANGYFAGLNHLKKAA